MTDRIREVKLPAELCEEAERKFGGHFGGLEPFISFVLRELVRDDAAQMDQDEQRIIENRLRDLGYV